MRANASRKPQRFERPTFRIGRESLFNYPNFDSLADMLVVLHLKEITYCE